MSKIDVLLINLPVSTWYKKAFENSNSMPPLGLLYIATVLKNADYQVKILDLSVNSISQTDFSDMLIEYSPKLVGLSTYNESWNSQKVLSKYIKEVIPSTKIFAGGAFATFCYEDVLNESLTDYVVLGEGEYRVLELCNIVTGKVNKNIEDIEGIAYKNIDGLISINNACSRIMDLDNLPIPDRELLDLQKYTLPYTISTARGCPGDCIFCSSRAFWGKKVIMRSAKSIFDEILFLNKQYDAKTFYVADDTFTASKKRAFDVCQMIKESKIKFMWGCESRADVVDEALIIMLKEAGCSKIQFGLESADNEVLKKLKKFVTIEQIENAISLACKHGMHITASFIVGHACDTEETIEKTLSFVKYIQTTYGVSIAASVNTPFPGTEQFDKSDELGLEIYSNNWNDYRLHNTIISTSNLSKNQIQKYYQRALDIASKNLN